MLGLLTRCVGGCCCQLLLMLLLTEGESGSKSRATPLQCSCRVNDGKTASERHAVSDGRWHWILGGETSFEPLTDLS